MDKIIDNIYNMGDREYDVFKFLVICLLISVAVTVYFALRIPGQLAERERVIQEWNAQNAERVHEIEREYNQGFTQEVIWYDSLR